MPVMKNNYDIYKKDNSRSRKTSECSNGGSTSAGAAPSVAAAMGVNNSAMMGGRRQRMKSESFASSPSHTYRMQMQRCQSQKTFPRNASRSSQCSSAGPMSPTRSFCQTSANSPPKNNASTNNTNTGTANTTGSQPDLTKFHLRLVEKLRKSFRKDSAKRSWKASLCQPEDSSNTHNTTKAENNDETTTTPTTTVCKQEDSGRCPQTLHEGIKHLLGGREQFKDHTDLPNGWPENSSTTPKSNKTTHKGNSCKGGGIKTQHHNYTASLAAQFGHRLSVPFVKCQRKLANLHLNHYQNQQFQQHHYLQQHQVQKQRQILDSNSGMAIHLLNSNSTVELYQQETEAKPIICSANERNKQLIKPPLEKVKKSPDKTFGQLRNARRRKRLSFMRRNTKSAPG